MTSRTDPLANSERQSDHWIVSQRSIVVEEALWLKFLWIWI